MGNQSYYDILGVAEDATQEEIRTAYRFIATSVHPDRFLNNSAYQRIAEERLKVINEAYSILKFPTSRSDYDSGRKSGMEQPSPEQTKPSGNWHACTLNDRSRIDVPRINFTRALFYISRAAGFFSAIGIFVAMLHRSVLVFVSFIIIGLFALWIVPKIATVSRRNGTMILTVILLLYGMYYFASQRRSPAQAVAGARGTGLVAGESSKPASKDRSSTTNISAMPTTRPPTIVGVSNGLLPLNSSAINTTKIAASEIPAEPANALKVVQSPKPSADPGVDVGYVRALTHLCAEPTAASMTILLLKPGSWVTLVSRSTDDGWIQVIDFSTGRQGWVQLADLYVTLTRHPNQPMVLSESSATSSGFPEIDITNDSDTPIYLHVGANSEQSIAAHATQAESIAEGYYSFNVSAPGVIPLFGTKAFMSGVQYSWRFWIGTLGGSNSHVADPALLMQTSALQKQITVDSQAADTLEQSLNVEKANLDAQEASLNAAQSDIDNKRPSLDDTNQQAVDDFNNEVDSTNAARDAYQTAQANYNSQVDTYSNLLTKLQSERRQLSDVDDKINQN